MESRGYKRNTKSVISLESHMVIRTGQTHTAISVLGSSLGEGSKAVHNKMKVSTSHSQQETDAATVSLQ